MSAAGSDPAPTPEKENKPMMDTVQVHSAIIEWDSGTEPTLLLHVDPTVVAHEAAVELYRNTQDDDTDDLPAFFATYPDPPVRDADLLAIWHDAYREATTVPWCTLDSDHVALPDQEPTPAAPATEVPNPFFDIKPGIVLGAYVKSTVYGHIGRVYQIHYECPEGAAWQSMQGYNVAAQPTKRWVGVLVDEGGAVALPETLVEVIPPFVLRNDSAVMYFGEGERG